jgi:multidrug resistance efflux pump
VLVDKHLASSGPASPQPAPTGGSAGLRAGRDADTEKRENQTTYLPSNIVPVLLTGKDALPATKPVGPVPPVIESAAKAKKIKESVVAPSATHVRWRQMAKLGPIVVLLTLGGLVAAMAVGFQKYNDAIVVAPGVLYPAKLASLRTPRVDGDQNLGRVAELFKQNGQTVQAGEPILRLDSQNETFQRDQMLKMIDSYQVALKDYARLKIERTARVQWAAARARQAAAELDAAQGRLEQYQALLKRAGAEPTALEINVAKEKVKYAERAEEEAKITYENYKALPPTAITEETQRKAKLAYERAVSLTQQSRDELTLLQKGDSISRLETAQAEVAQAKAAIAAAQARLDERQKETQLLEMETEIEVKARLLEGDLEKARLEVGRLESLIKDKTLRSPISGVLQRFTVQPGQWVGSRDTLGWVCDSNLVFCAQVNQRDLPKISMGQKAKVQFDMASGPLIYNAECIEISDLLSGSTTEDSDLLQLFPQTLPRTIVATHAIVRLKILGPVAPASVPAAPDAGATAPTLRAGFAGRAKIRVGDGKIAELFY